jgi:catechol 2,3-dioxygenase
MENGRKTGTIHPEVRIGHAHLRVADLERATAFYHEVLGFDITFYGPEIGLNAVFLSAGGYHHHIALNTFLSAGGAPPPPGHTGLHHVAILYPNRHELAKAVKQVLEHGYMLDEADDNGVSVAVYLNDPDGNGLELSYDRPREQWTDEQGKPVFQYPKPFDPRELLSELESGNQ